MSVMQLCSEVNFTQYSESIVLRLHALFKEKKVEKACLSACLAIEDQLYDHAMRDARVPEGTPLFTYVPAINLYRQRSEFLLKTLKNLPPHMWPNVANYKPSRIHVQFAIPGKRIKVTPLPARIIAANLNSNSVMPIMKASMLASEGTATTLAESSSSSSSSSQMVQVDDVDDDGRDATTTMMKPTATHDDDELDLQLEDTDNWWDTVQEGNKDSNDGGLNLGQVEHDNVDDDDDDNVDDEDGMMMNEGGGGDIGLFQQDSKSL